AFTHQPEEINGISAKAADSIKRAFAEIDPARLVDYHTHIAGIGTSGANTFVNPKMLTWRRPFHRLKFKIYLSAGAVEDVEQADEQMVQRLVRMGSNIEGHGKHRLLAFDKNYLRERTAHLEKAEFYVASGYDVRLRGCA